VARRDRREDMFDCRRKQELTHHHRIVLETTPLLERADLADGDD